MTAMPAFFHGIAVETRRDAIREALHLRSMIRTWGTSDDYRRRLKAARNRARTYAKEARAIMEATQ